MRRFTIVFRCIRRSHFTGRKSTGGGATVFYGVHEHVRFVGSDPDQPDPLDSHPFDWSNPDPDPLDLDPVPGEPTSGSRVDRTQRIQM